MKVLQSSVFRAVCAIIVGILLIQNPDNTVKGITIAIGVLFLMSGAISCAVWLNARASASKVEEFDADGNQTAGRRPMFPIVGLGSFLLGLVLALMPGTFVTSLMYMLGALVILGALGQFMSLVGMGRISHVPLWFWIAPTVIFLTGLFVVIKPMETAGLPLLIIGWCLLLYGATECINAIKINRDTKKAEKGQRKSQMEHIEKSQPKQ